MLKLSLSEYLHSESNDLLNYKGSGLPKFQKFKARVFPGLPHQSIPTIIESESDLEALIEYRYNHEINLVDIIRLYGEHNIQFSSDIVINLPIEDVTLVREYARNRNIYSTRRPPEKYDELLEDIKINGIQQCGKIRIRRNEECNIEAILGEGNHRLAIAKELNISSMPIRIVYTT